MLGCREEVGKVNEFALLYNSVYSVCRNNTAHTHTHTQSKAFSSQNNRTHPTEVAA